MQATPGDDTARADDDAVYADARAYLRAEDKAWDRAIAEAVGLYGARDAHNSKLLAMAKSNPDLYATLASLLARDGPSAPVDVEWERLNQLARGERMRPLFPDDDAALDVPPAGITGELAPFNLDWLELTDLHDDTGRSFMKLLDLPEGEWVDMPRGLRGYRKQRRCGDVVLLTDGAAEMGAHLIVSGEGCRELERRAHTFSWQRLARKATQTYKMRCGRLDLFKDERAGVLTVDSIREKLEADAWTSRSQLWDDYRSRRRGGQRRGDGVTVGNRASARFLRVYDKAAELAPRKGTIAERATWLQRYGPHTRFELESKDEQAHAALEYIAEHGLSHDFIAGLLARFIEFKEETADGAHANRVAAWGPWLAFLQNAAKIRLAIEYLKTPLQRTEQWLWEQASVSMWQLWSKYNGDVSLFLRMIRHGALKAKKHHLARLKGEGISPPRIINREDPWVMVVNHENLAA